MSAVLARRSSLAAVMLAASLLAAGCSTLPQVTSPAASQAHQAHLASLTAIRDFGLDGRMGVQTDGRGVSGSLQWQHSGQHDDISLYSPLGSKIASVAADPGLVTLVDSDGKRYSASDAESLTQQTLGWRMPVTYLVDWVLGRPSSGDVESASWDAQGRITRLRQHGWEVDYQEYKPVAGRQLPSRLTLRNPQLYLKLVISRWDIPDTTITNDTAPTP